MDIEQWEGLFGKASDDPDVVAAPAGAGIPAPRIGRDRTEVRVEVPRVGITLIFTDEAFLYRRDDMQLREGGVILSGILLMLQHSKETLYRGPLPRGLTRDDSPTTLRKRFGPPEESGEVSRWDQWRIGDRVLIANYDKDLKAISRVSIMLPGAA